MLKKVEMPPTFFHGVVGLETCLATIWAGKRTSPGKMELDIQALLLRIEIRGEYLPGRSQAKSQLEKVCVFHKAIWLLG
jgi:hypothetical protein